MGFGAEGFRMREEAEIGERLAKPPLIVGSAGQASSASSSPRVGVRPGLDGRVRGKVEGTQFSSGA